LKPWQSQQAVAVRTTWQLRGVVSRLNGDDVVPVPGARVVLHRIGTEQGPVDSVLADARGEFRFQLRSTESDSAHYLITSSRHGVAYVAQLGRVADLDTASADLLVFDTTSVPVPTTVVHRHLLVMAPALGAERRVLEVYGIANDSSVTRVSAGASSPVWTARLPSGANGFVAGAVGANPHSLSVQDGEVKMYGPLAPGVHEIEFSYTLPHSSFPLESAVQSGTEWLEVILEEAGATALGPGLVDEGVLNLIGKNFYHHYTALSTDSGTIIINVPEGAPFTLASYLTVVVSVVGAAMLVTLLIAFRKRRVAVVPVAPTPPGMSAAELLASQIAELDLAHGSRAHVSEADAAAYRSERALLKKKLAALLARDREST
jgi:hypothetical protein